MRTRRKNLSIGINVAFKKKVQEKIATLGMGLENKINQSMGNLSDGQRQALTLLMSVMDDTYILLLGEPTAGLDLKSAVVVLNLPGKLNKDFSITTMLITNDLKEALQYGSRLIQVNNGKIIRDLNNEAKGKLSLQEIYKWFE